MVITFRAENQNEKFKLLQQYNNNYTCVKIQSIPPEQSQNLHQTFQEFLRQNIHKNSK